MSKNSEEFMLKHKRERGRLFIKQTLQIQKIDTIRNRVIIHNIEIETGELRLVPKTNNAESRSLLITNLQRPFLSIALQERLEKERPVKRLWINFVKTHCYVEVNIYNIV
jgi:hypothetical protein